MNVQPDADPDVHRFDVTTRKPISCQRRGCTNLGTVLCAACQQASYCSSECLYLDFKGNNLVELTIKIRSDISQTIFYPTYSICRGT